jgi:hypothetical protein
MAGALVLIVLFVTTLTFNLTNLGQQSHAINSTENDVNQWFRNYDSIRRQAKMSLREKLSGLRLLSLAMGPFGLPVDESKKLLLKMIERYEEAAQGMNKLSKVPQTEELQSGYIKYFTDAKQLFQDTLEAPLDDPEAQRKRVNQLMERKHALERLDITNKALDTRLRKQFHIPAFHG